MQKTKVVDQDLSPVWDETFVFSTKHAESCLLSSQPKIFFELWDKDFLSPDEFLGQVWESIDINSGSLQCTKMNSDDFRTAVLSNFYVSERFSCFGVSHLQIVHNFAALASVVLCTQEHVVARVTLHTYSWLFLHSSFRES